MENRNMFVNTAEEIAFANIIDKSTHVLSVEEQVFVNIADSDILVKIAVEIVSASIID